MSEPQTTLIDDWSKEDLRDLSRSACSELLCYASRSRTLRKFAIKAANYLEQGQFFSFTIREILRRHYQVQVGAYSYGACLEPGAIPPSVVFGRYCSIAHGLRIHRRNHPLDRLSMHPFFFNTTCGVTSEETVSCQPLTIGHDAWIGERVIVTPGCCNIGIGAVVGAGAVLTRDVPDFAVVAGNPAKLIRMRFPDQLCEDIRRSQWWTLPLSACKEVLADMLRPLRGSGRQHPLLNVSSHHECTETRLERNHK